MGSRLYLGRNGDLLIVVDSEECWELGGGNMCYLVDRSFMIRMCAKA